MEAKSLGIIGGMGPKATAVFVDQVIENTVASRDQDHINMVILNHATLPDRTTAIIEQKGALFIEAIAKDLLLLETAGVAHIAIPCNTSHYFYDQLQAMTTIPIIHMIEETVQAIVNQYGEQCKVGLLATDGTIRSGVYEKGCKKYNLELYTPNEVLQEQIMNIIYNNIKSGIDMESGQLETIIEELIVQEKCSCVIIGCTELSCIQLSEKISPFTIDAMGVLVERSIQLSGKQVKKQRRHPSYTS